MTLKDHIGGWKYVALDRSKNRYKVRPGGQVTIFGKRNGVTVNIYRQVQVQKKGGGWFSRGGKWKDLRAQKLGNVTVGPGRKNRYSGWKASKWVVTKRDYLFGDAEEYKRERAYLVIKLVREGSGGGGGRRYKAPAIYTAPVQISGEALISGSGVSLTRGIPMVSGGPGSYVSDTGIPVQSAVFSYSAVDDCYGSR